MFISVLRIFAGEGWSSPIFNVSEISLISSVSKLRPVALTGLLRHMKLSSSDSSSVFISFFVISVIFMEISPRAVNFLSFISSESEDFKDTDTL